MDLPELLADRVREARRALAGDPAHDLPSGRRVAIWAALEPAPDTYSALGKRRRARLALLAVEHVHELWTAACSDDLPARIAAVAEQVLADPPRASEHLGDVGRYWAEADGVLASAGDAAWMLVAYAAVAALRTALFDEAVHGAAGHDATPEASLDLDPYSRDATYWAAGAYAGGTVLQPASDPQRRREFWEWWLTTAVPSALRQA